MKTEQSPIRNRIEGTICLFIVPIICSLIVSDRYINADVFNIDVPAWVVGFLLGLSLEGATMILGYFVYGMIVGFE